jgi:hypothetical protein
MTEVNEEVNENVQFVTSVPGDADFATTTTPSRISAPDSENGGPGPGTDTMILHPMTPSSRLKIIMRRVKKLAVLRLPDWLLPRYGLTLRKQMLWFMPYLSCQ